MPATLHDVAAKADLSIATVSRAINGLAVSPRARLRVEAAIAELGYVANEAARTLRNERSNTIGVVFQNLRNTLGLELVDTIGAAIEDQGFVLLIASARGDAERYDLLMRRFLERRVDGLFCISPRGASRALAGYAKAGIPVVTLFESRDDFTGLPLLSPSFREGAQALAGHLRNLRHQRVALLARSASPAMDAITAALRAEGLTTDARRVAQGQGLRDVLATIIMTPDRATTVITELSLSADLAETCAAMGVDVPRQLSLIGVGESATRPRDERSGLTTLTIRPEFLGRAAGESLLAWLNDGTPPPSRRVSAAAYEPRRTTAMAVMG